MTVSNGILKRGRVLDLSDPSEGNWILLRSEGRNHTVPIQNPPAPLQRGDLVEVRQLSESPIFEVKLLTSNRSGKTPFTDHVQNPRRQHGMKIRTQVEKGIHEFFEARDFLHTRTPLLVPSPGMEPHIRPFQTQQGPYLPTSPEFAMKRLLAGGLERIYQICPAFRFEPFSRTHFPEFTLLEWYRAYAGWESIMQDTEELLFSLAQKLHGRRMIQFQNQKIDLQPPWPRLRVVDLFEEHTQIDLRQNQSLEQLTESAKKLGIHVSQSSEQNQTEDSWDDLYFKIWLDHVEPHLPNDRAVFVTHYPASQAALAVTTQDPDGLVWAKRFEAYAGGIELANAFEELTDPVEQRNRFEKDMDLREAVYGDSFPRTPLDEGFLTALEEGLPPSGGIALGVDRLIMLLADEPDIEFTHWLPPAQSE